MKLYKVEGNKAKASVIAKNRVKTPFKGELMLKPSDGKSKKTNITSKRSSIDIKGNTKKRNIKTPGKKNTKNNTKTKK